MDVLCPRRAMSRMPAALIGTSVAERERYVRRWSPGEIARRERAISPRHLADDGGVVVHGIDRSLVDPTRNVGACEFA